jgi:hypothetical protein
MEFIECYGRESSRGRGLQCRGREGEMKAARTFFLIPMLCATWMACQSKDYKPEEATESTYETSDSAGVARESPATEAAPATSPAAASLTPIATRAGSDGLEVDLMRAGVTGDLLTAELRYRNPTSGPTVLIIPIADVSYIDDSTARRYSVVKDQAGVFMAAPLNSMKQTIVQVVVIPSKSEIVWFKFPAPPAESRTVSINIPQVGPFDGISVQR